MPSSGDFRAYAFDASRVGSSGRYIGHTVYWKLYALENLLRVAVHSILSVQAPPDWWMTAVHPKLREDIDGRKKNYLKNPEHTVPGSHDIYYAYLPELGKIIATNSHLFERIIPDINDWITRIEQIRLPRNIVGHMNWPSKADQRCIDSFYSDSQGLIRRISGAGIRLIIP